MIIDIQYTPILSISEEYKADSVIVTVEWTQAQQLHVTYSTEVFPLVPIVFTERTSRRLTIPYNNEYNLSVVAVTPCRPNATSFIILYYGEVYYLKLYSCMV